MMQRLLPILVKESFQRLFVGARHTSHKCLPVITHLVLCSGYIRSSSLVETNSDNRCDCSGQTDTRNGLKRAANQPLQLTPFGVPIIGLYCKQSLEYR